MAVLIIGASGYVGSYVYQVLKNNGNEQCIGTRFHLEDSNLVEFDLVNGDIRAIDREIVEEDKKVLICSADSNIEYCGINRESAYEKNVISTIRTINTLSELGYHITFLSTDNVFDGVKGDYTEEDITNPINEYGKMKREVEEYLMSNIPNSCIMRIGKAVGNFTKKGDLLREWYNKAQKQEKIYCICGNKMNLVHMDDIVASFSLLSSEKLTGIYHVSGKESGFRKDLCQRFLNYMEIEYEMIEVALEEFRFVEKKPLNTTMKSTKFVSQTGYCFMDLESIWRKFKNAQLW